ncbi:MAG: hypothetical protein JNJ60_14780 [Rhodocyclaceae bacterium]|nr:hypothetical protein [Rhodocyclaceae bacterium]
MFAAARRIYSGAGFNAVLEARAAPHKHRLLAFERALDDQHARLAEFRAAQAGAAAPPPQPQPAP